MSDPGAQGRSAHAPGWAATLVRKPAFWLLALAILFGWPIARALLVRLPPKLPVLGTLGDFALRDQTGQAFGSAQLRGKVWVADFIFTRCPTVCPLLTERLGKVQHRSRNLGSAFHLVSFSVDPEHDTPEVLAAYTGKHRVSPRLWSFLTGDLATIEKTVVQGLKVGMGREDSAPGGTFHDTHFVLVDQHLRIRGYYASEEADEIDRLLRDVSLLIARE